jgi:hypothetical protein
MGKRRNAYWVFGGESKRKRPLVRPGHGWGDNIKPDLERGGIGGCKLNLAHSRDIWGAFMNSLESSGPIICREFIDQLRNC